MDMMVDRLRVRPGHTGVLAGRDPASTNYGPLDPGVAAELAPAQSERLAILQDRLFAGHRRSVLLVVQGVDCAGKGAAIRFVTRGLNPAGTRVVSFRVPSGEELARDFLWRVHEEVPAVGQLTIFNRSHYEDVTTVRVRRLTPERAWRLRFDHINAFELLLGDAGTKVVKILLHVSQEEQAKRLRERMGDPASRWRVSADDIADHERWPAYQTAFSEMLDRTATDQASWYVIPADNWWFRDWAVAEVLIATLAAMDPKYPSLPALPDMRAY